MNARDKTPLRAQIADRLAAGEDTAAGIAKAIGKGDTPSIVVKELNAMRTDGQVECEQRGKKKELVYWLAVPLDVAAASVEPAPSLPPATIGEVMLPPGVRHGTRAAQIYRVLPLYGAKPMTARQIAKATGATLGLISPTLSGMVKAGQISRVLADPCEAYGYTRLPPAGGDSEGGETDVKTQSAEIPPPIPPQIPPPQHGPNSVAFSASTDAEQDQQRAHFHLIGLLADIRAAAGDPEGKLMQDELIERVRETARARAIAQVDLDTIRATLRPLVYTGDPAHAPGPVRCAEHAAQWIQSLGETNREQLAGIVAASETLAPLVPGDIDTSDMGLQEIAERVAAGVADLTARRESKEDELLKQAAVIVDLRNQLEGLQREAMRGATCLSGQDRYTAAGYLVRASKRKPRTLLSEDKAREAAMSSIRTGAPWAAVYALVPIGWARRGVEWWSA